jgi:RNA-splicing ligase RtcB
VDQIAVTRIAGAGHQTCTEYFRRFEREFPDITRSLPDRQHIYVKARSRGTLAEEAPGAYKDVDEVIRVSEALGIGTKVARMRPVANIKG